MYIFCKYETFYDTLNTYIVFIETETINTAEFFSLIIMATYYMWYRVGIDFDLFTRENIELIIIVTYTRSWR